MSNDYYLIEKKDNFKIFRTIFSYIFPLLFALVLIFLTFNSYSSKTEAVQSEEFHNLMFRETGVNNQTAGSIFSLGSIYIFLIAGAALTTIMHFFKVGRINQKSAEVTDSAFKNPLVYYFSKVFTILFFVLGFFLFLMNHKNMNGVMSSAVIFLFAWISFMVYRKKLLQNRYYLDILKGVLGISMVITGFAGLIFGDAFMRGLSSSVGLFKIIGTAKIFMSVFILFTAVHFAELCLLFGNEERDLQESGTESDI